MKLYYVAHPVGADPVKRQENVDRALRWFSYLLKRYPDDAFVIPWLPYVRVLEETRENRSRGIRDDLAALDRCDGIVLVGGQMSAGMAGELEAAGGKIVRDLLHLGAEPPRGGVHF